MHKQVGLIFFFVFLLLFLFKKLLFLIMSMYLRMGMCA